MEATKLVGRSALETAKELIQEGHHDQAEGWKLFARNLLRETERDARVEERSHNYAMQAAFGDHGQG